MPEVTLKHEIDTDEDTFWEKVVFNEEFNKKLFEGALKFPAWTLLDQKEDDAKITRKVTVSPPTGDLSAALKKVIGDRLSYTEEGTFDKKIRRLCRISVEVKIFMVGGMVEERIMKDLRSSYDDSTAATNAYIKENGL